MPDFTVIEGGGEKRDWNRQYAERLFQEFAVALVRGVGGGESHPIVEKFFRFLEHMEKTRLPVGPTIDAAMRELNQGAFNQSEDRSDYEVERMKIRLAAWRVTVEHMTDDGLSKARRSKREMQMIDAIDQMVLGHEERTREHGWSYLGNLTKHLGKWPARKR